MLKPSRIVGRMTVNNPGTSHPTVVEAAQLTLDSAAAVSRAQKTMNRLTCIITFLTLVNTVFVILSATHAI